MRYEFADEAQRDDYHRRILSAHSYFNNNYDPARRRTKIGHCQIHDKTAYALALGGITAMVFFCDDRGARHKWNDIAVDVPLLCLHPHSSTQRSGAKVLKETIATWCSNHVLGPIATEPNEYEEVDYREWSDLEDDADSDGGQSRSRLGKEEAEASPSGPSEADSKAA